MAARLRGRHSPVSAMTHARLSSLLVIALLQLSQTEISSTLPESWYAANVINDGAIYSPKPISEIFSTPPTFSTTNPIVVLSSSTTSDPTSATSTSSSTPTPTSPVNTTVPSSTERSVKQEVSVVPLSTEQPPPPQTSQSSPVTFIIETQTTSKPPPQLPDLSVYQQPPSPPLPPPIVPTPEQIQIRTAQQGIPPPNYFLVYQQAPQIPSQAQPLPLQLMFNYPPPTVTSTSTKPTSNAPLSSTIPPTSTVPPTPTAPSTSIAPSTSMAPPTPIRSTTLLLSTASPSSRALPLSQTIGTSTEPPVSISSTVSPPCTVSGSNTSPRLPSLKIRLVAPSGSVTNIKLNEYPPTTTTRRPPKTTTRRPTTPKPRRNRNTYDGCMIGCGGPKIPICASPLGISPIDPDTLKGFPSVCHMACHNSFRKNLYEKVTDGRCGKLRNRIKPIDSKNKLKKADLDKTSYTIVQSGPSVVEFSPLTS